MYSVNWCLLEMHHQRHYFTMTIYIYKLLYPTEKLRYFYCFSTKNCYIALDKALFFHQKMSIFFLFLNENICCGYSLQGPHRGTSNEYPQHTFLGSNKKTIYLIPTFI